MLGTREIQVDGTPLAYVDAGPADAEVVLLLHGYVGSHRTWRHLIAPLSERYRVLAVDWFGWGESGRNPELAYDYETEVARLGRVMDALGLTRASVVGHDYGGFLSLGFALRYPERVARLCIVNSRAHGTFNAQWRTIFGLVGWLCRHRSGRAMVESLPLGAVFRRSMRPLVQRGYLDEATLEHYVGWMDDDPLGRAYLTRFHADYRVAARPELAAGLGRLRCPTAVAWGARDPYLPTTIAEELAQRISSCSLTLIDDAGHFFPEERPDILLESLEQLLMRNEVTV